MNLSISIANCLKPVILIGVLLFQSEISLATENLQIEQVMSDSDQDQIGIKRFSPKQRAAFEQWITDWTQRVVEQAPSYHISDSIPHWVASWPVHQSPNVNPTSKTASISRRQVNSIIYKNQNGRQIDLKDGSQWKIRSIDTSVAQYWLRGDSIRIESSTDIYYPYILKNESRDKQAQASLITPPSESGEVASHPSAYFEGSILIQNSTKDGVSLSLQDGTKWSIAPEDQYKVSNWIPKDRVKVEKNRQFLYSYTIKNLDSGEEARADKTR